MSLTLTAAELSELCPGITQPAAMVRHLQGMGFVRAHLHNGKVVLSRTHYDAVERGVMSFEAVFMPHMLTDNGMRLIDRVQAENLLPAPNGV